LDLFAQYGYIGLFLAAFLAATILPFSSEALLLFLIHQTGHWPLLVLIASLGNILGSVVNYWMGYSGSRLLLHKWLRLDDKTVERAERHFTSYGKYSLLFAWLPVVGDPLTVAAGLFKMPFALFLVLVSIGKAGRYLALAWSWQLVA